MMARLRIPYARRRSRTLDDDRPRVSFRFEGRRIDAPAGQSLAAALMADGVHVLTRSFKLHRPRGYTCGYDACPNCPLTVDGLPGVTSCVTPVRGGEQVRRERGWPSADVDLLATTNLFSRFLGAGFQFRHLARHPRLARWWERAMAQVAGAGRMPEVSATAGTRAARTLTRRPDVLVIGGGRSGCAAAVAAARAGATTVLVHRDVLGGRSRCRRPYDDADPVDAVASSEDIEVIAATVVGRFESGVLPAVGGGQLHELAPKAVVVATGSYDLPLAFPGNDKPGVMLASGVRRLLYLDRVLPGRRAVVVADGADGGRLAAELVDHGVEVVAVVTPRELVRAVGTGRVRAVEVGPGRRRLRCDLVCVAAGERPADELVLQSLYLATDDMTRVTRWEPGDDFAGRLSDDTWVVGSAAGWSDGDARCTSAGAEAAAYAGRVVRDTP